MNNIMMNDQLLSDEELTEQSRDCLFELAFRQHAQAEMFNLQESMEEEQTTLSAQENEQLYQKQRPVIARIVQQALRPNKRKRSFKQSMPKVLRVAAIVICILSLLLGTAYAAIPAFRKQILNLLISFEEGHADLQLLKGTDPLALSVPDDWMGSFYPAWLPENFKAQVKLSNEITVSHNVFFAAPTDYDKYVEFSENGQNVNVSINTEEMIKGYHHIQGRETLVLEGIDYLSLVWTAEDSYFILTGNLEKDVMLRIAQSVVKTD